MKLKRSFSASLLIIPIITCFLSCSSTNISVPVPGETSVRVHNIYVEYYNLGENFYKLKDYKKAAEYYELAMRKKDLYWASCYKLAKCYAFSSEWDKALTLYKKMLERDSENESLKASVAYIYSMQGDFKNALSLYEELLAAQPKNQNYLENYIAILLALEKNFASNYAEKYTAAYSTLKEEYPENKNLKIFEEKYNQLIK